MKNPLHVLPSATLACLAFTQIAAGDGPTTRRAPDSLTYMVRNYVTPTDGVTNAISGTFQFQYVERGEKVRESVVLRVSGLEPNAMSHLTAALGDDPAAVQTVATLPADAKGRWKMTLTTKTPAPVRPSRIPPVPELMSPLTHVGAICVEDSSGKLLANGGVFDAYQFQYSAKRNLTPVDSSGTAAGWMVLVGNQRRSSLVLVAGGLEPSTEYFVVMNSETVGAIATNERGYLKMKAWPDTAPPLLELRSLEVVGPSGAVLTTTLPR